MRALLRLAWQSLANRRFTALLTIATIAISVTLLLGVERLRQEARSSFLRTLSGTDLIVGARADPVQLLLYSVFRLGDATNNVSWESYRMVADDPRVAWTIPLSLGDSHRGYPGARHQHRLLRPFALRGRPRPVVRGRRAIFRPVRRGARGRGRPRAGVFAG